MGRTYRVPYLRPQAAYRASGLRPHAAPEARRSTLHPGEKGQRAHDSSHAAGAEPGNVDERCWGVQRDPDLAPTRVAESPIHASRVKRDDDRRLRSLCSAEVYWVYAARIRILVDRARTFQFWRRSGTLMLSPASGPGFRFPDARTSRRQQASRAGPNLRSRNGAQGGRRRGEGEAKRLQVREWGEVGGRE